MGVLISGAGGGNAKSNDLSAFINLFKSFLGAGILGLPYAMKMGNLL